jgi:RNA polymerase sigma factor (sigma-70 family)
MDQGDRHLLKLFKCDMEQFPMLSREDEDRAARQAMGGDEASAEQLINSNLRFVLKIVFQHWRPDRPLMDLISEGCIGLIKAMKTFDPDKGCRFLTYAESAIKQRVIGAIIHDRKHDMPSLDERIYPDGEETTKGELLVSDDAGADELYFDEQVRRLLDCLNDREKTVIHLRFWEGKTLDEVGRDMGMYAESARQIEARALRKMRWSISKVSSRKDWGCEENSHFLVTP